MRQLGARTAAHRRVMSGSVVAAALTVGAVALGATSAGGADAGWSRAPASGIGGGTVQVASSASTLCQWIQPTNPDPGAAPDGSAPASDPASATGGLPDASATTPSGDTVYDGTEVRIRLSQDGVEIPLPTLDVSPGGAWSGTITLPGADQLVPGEYEMFAKCVIDRPELDGVRTYDFDPLAFTVVEAPPPTTVEIPTELIPPITAVNPVQVQGEQLTRPTAPVASSTAAASAATLPNTGDGTSETALAGLGALLVGGAALWWGARHGRRQPSTDLAD